MLRCFLVIEVIAMNIATKSISLYGLHLMKGIIVNNNRNNSTHWLLTRIDNFYKSIMESYVYLYSLCKCNMCHTCVFVIVINIYRYVYNYVWKTMIICDKELYKVSQKIHMLIIGTLIILYNYIIYFN